MSLINEDLILENLDLVRIVAIKFQNQYLGYYDIDDLIGNGMFGLINAASTYNPNEEVPFRNWAYKKIYWSIIDGLRSFGIQYRKNKSEKHFPIYFADLNFNETTEENLYPDFNWENDFNEIENKIDYQKLYNSINKLSERDQRVLNLYYWKDKNQKEIGNEMGFSESRACQVLKLAIGNLKNIYFNKDSNSKRRSDQEIREIRQLYKTGNYTMAKIAEMFNISDQCIFDIVHYKSYKKVRDAV